MQSINPRLLCIASGFTKYDEHADSDTITLEDQFSRDVRNIGHYGTGDLETNDL